MTDFCEHLGADWLTQDALDRQDQRLDAERLRDVLVEVQPAWQHSLIIGEGGIPAVVSEFV